MNMFENTTQRKPIDSVSETSDIITYQLVSLIDMFLKENFPHDCKMYKKGPNLYQWWITPVSQTGIYGEGDRTEFWNVDRYGTYRTLFTITRSFPYEISSLSSYFNGTIYENLWKLVYSYFFETTRSLPGGKNWIYPSAAIISENSYKINIIASIATDKEELNMNIKTVFFNEVKGITTVVFNDHTSVIVRCMKGDAFDPEVGLAMALSRKYFGSRTKFQKFVQDWVKKSEPKNIEIKEKLHKKSEQKNPESDT